MFVPGVLNMIASISRNDYKLNMNSIYDEGDHKMCYLPLILHEVCMTDTPFEKFKQVVETHKENINVELHDQGNPIQILVQNPSLATYDKFKLLIENGAEPDGGTGPDVFGYICDREYNSNYIAILEYLFENNLFHESPWCIIESGEFSNMSDFTIESGVTYQFVERSNISSANIDQDGSKPSRLDIEPDSTNPDVCKIYHDYTPGKTITQFPILLLAKHKEYLPTLRKYKDKLTRVYSLSDFISTMYD